MRIKQYVFNFIVASIVAAGIGCAKAPPNLTPAAQTAFKQTQIIKALDMIRDTAIAANATVPPLLNVKTTGTVVTWHWATIVVVHSAAQGWQAAALKSLDELGTNLAATDRPHLVPYITLARTLVEEVLR